MDIFTQAEASLSAARGAIAQITHPGMRSACEAVIGSAALVVARCREEISRMTEIGQAHIRRATEFERERDNLQLALDEARRQHDISAGSAELVRMRCDELERAEISRDWIPIETRMPGALETADWLFPPDAVKRERWILCTEALVSASLPGRATHWRPAAPLPPARMPDPVVVAPRDMALHDAALQNIMRAAGTPPARQTKGSASTDSCTWTQDLESDAWDTSCGEKWYFPDGGTPLQNGMRFCHHCGKPLKEGGAA